MDKQKTINQATRAIESLYRIAAANDIQLMVVVYNGKIIIENAALFPCDLNSYPGILLGRDSHSLENGIKIVRRLRELIGYEQ